MNDYNKENFGNENEINFVELFKSVLKRIWIVLLISFIFGIFGYKIGESKESVDYSTKFTVYFDYLEDNHKNADGFIVDLNENKNTQVLTQYYELLLNSDSFINEIVSDYNCDIFYSQVENVGNALTIIVNGDDLEKNLNCANSIIKNGSLILKEKFPEGEVSLINFPESIENMNGNRYKEAFLYFFVGLIVSGGILFLFEIIQNRVNDCDEFTKRTNQEILNENLKNEKDFYSFLRTKIIYSAKESNVLGFANVSEGKDNYTLIENTAKSFKEIGKNVIILNLNMRSNCNFQKKINNADEIFKNELNNIETINGFAENKNGINILNFANVLGDPTIILENNRMYEIIRILKNEYDYVFCILPSICQYPDAMICAKYVDMFVPVAYLDKTRYKDVFNSLNKIKLTNTKIFGFILK